MIHSIERLRTGDTRQQEAYKTILQLNILNDLQHYHPVLCGTYPLAIFVEDSDLDIILQAFHLDRLESDIRRFYSGFSDFSIKRKRIRDQEVIKANFQFHTFMFELFGQKQAVDQQNAYLHMVIEDHILKQNPTFKREVIRLKQEGMNTEACFCKLLRLEGDPFEQLLLYGKQTGIIG